MKPLGITLILRYRNFTSKRRRRAKCAVIFLSIAIFMTGSLWATDIDGTDFNGYKWWDTAHGDSADDIPVTYYINSSGTPDCTGEFDAIDDSFDTWENVTTSYIAFTDGGTTGDTDYGEADGNNIIGWSTSLSAGTIAVCYTYYYTSSMRIYDSDIEFNDDDYTWDTSGTPTALQMDVQNIATHEIGHFFGLADTYTHSENTMYGYADLGETKKRTLTAADEQCISYVYSAASLTDDSYEDNDYSQQAATISAGTHSGLYLRNDDWYKISLSVGDDITVSISFTDANGDVDLKLYNPSLSFLDGSYGVGDSEEVSATDVTTAGTYYILVYGYECDTNTYSMTITTTAAPTPSGITGGGGSSGGKVCFIATAVYDGYTNQHEITRTERMQNNTRIHTNPRFPVSPFPRFAASPDDPVIVLCRFRDEYLLTNAPGRVFVSCYERISPPIARYIENKEPLKAVVRFYLKPVVWLAEKVISNPSVTKTSDSVSPIKAGNPQE